MRTDRTPHIVLAVMPDAVQARLEALRRAHYPPDRNHSPAHCTLFHAVPGMVAAELTGLLATLTAQTPPPRAQIDRVLDLDSGTALGVFSPDLVALREMVADHFHGLLTGGDAVAARLHVTIQNKVDRPAARALQRTSTPPFRRWRFTAWSKVRGNRSAPGGFAPPDANACPGLT